MKRHDWTTSAFLTLSLVLCLGVSRAAQPTTSAGPGLDGSAGGAPVMQAVDPETARRQTPAPDDRDRPIQRRQNAVLPDPLNGRELIDRLRAEDLGGRPIVGLPGRGAAVQHVMPYQRFAAPPHTLPVARG